MFDIESSIKIGRRNFSPKLSKKINQLLLLQKNHVNLSNN